MAKRPNSRRDSLVLLAAAVAAPVVVAAAWFGISGSGSAGGHSSEPVSQGELARTQSELTGEEQQAALADGVVTRGEYEQATRRAWQCTKDAGVAIGDLSWSTGNLLTSTVGPYATFEELEKADKLVEDCNGTYVNDVRRMWSRQNAPGPETIERARQDLRNCLAGVGIAVPENAGPGEFAEIARQADARFGQCSDEVSLRYNIAHFGG